LDIFWPSFVVDFFEDFYLCYFRKSRKTPGGNAARVMARLHQQRARAILSFQLLQNCGAFLLQESFRPALMQRLGTDLSGTDGRLFLIQLLGSTLDITSL
jgi:hypothetical protein